MKKLLSVFLVSFFVLTGCGSNSQKSDVATEITGPVTVEFWHPFTAGVESKLQELTDKFNKENTDGITVNLTNQGKYDDLYNKIKASGESNSLPTMAISYATWEDAFQYFDKLNSYEGVGNTNLKFDNIVDAYLDEVKDSEGSIYGVPYNKSTEVIFYNKDLLEKANITEAPKTMEELFADAKKVTDATGVVGLGFDSLINYLATLMTSNGLDSWMDKDGNFVFDDKKIQDGIKMYQDAIKEGYARTPGEDGYLSGPFSSGNVAAFVGSTAGASYVQSGVDGKFNWGSAVLPSSKVIEQGANIVVFNTAKPEEKLAAWKYIDFLLQDENVVDFAASTGYLPVTNTAIESDAYKKVIENDEVAKAAVDTKDKFKTVIPQFKGANEIYQTNFKRTMNEILDGKSDIDKKLKELNQSAKSVYDLNNI